MGYLAAMTSGELIAEKAKNLTEGQAEMVLAYMDELAASPRPTALDLTRLPAGQRRAVLRMQASKADELYRSDPQLICEDTEGPIPYAILISWRDLGRWNFGLQWERGSRSLARLS
jgi:hypothetical protein